MKTVAVLFARADSIYKTLPECDVFDIDRDARTFAGGIPVVAHPPCRAWGRLASFAKPRHDEKELAMFAVDQVRACGGVLEHPARSNLWPAAQLPAPGSVDVFGGFTMPINQHWWGHKAEKATWLYIVGVSPRDVPAMPMTLERPTHCVAPPHGMRAGHPDWRPIITKPERERTPPALARWLVDLAQICGTKRLERAA